MPMMMVCTSLCSMELYSRETKHMVHLLLASFFVFGIKYEPECEKILKTIAAILKMEPANKTVTSYINKYAISV